MSSFTSEMTPTRFRRLMTRFRRLAFVCTVSTLVLVGSGGLVRATGSGLGCLDEWPTCFGGWIAPLEYQAMIEWSHRALAGVVGVLVLSLAAAAWRWLPGQPLLRRLSYLALVVVIVQAALGRFVVTEHLHATIVTAHFLTASALVAILVGVTVGASVTGRGQLTADQRKASRMAVGAVIGLALVMVSGALTRERAAGLAFLDWPLMHGRPIPGLQTVQEAIHLSHRVLVVVVLAHLVVLVLRTRTDTREWVRSLGWVLAALYAAQVVVGGLNVVTALAPAAVLGHVALGVLAWAAVVALAVASRAGSHPVPLTSAAAAQEPVGAGGQEPGAGGQEPASDSGDRRGAT